MKTFVLLGIFLCARLLSAQSTTPSVPQIGQDPISVASREMELFTRFAQQSRAEEVRHAAATRAQEAARREFEEKADKFVALWSDFATRINQQQVFDAKLAKKLSKAFHELERSDGWPIRGEPTPGNSLEK